MLTISKLSRWSIDYYNDTAVTAATDPQSAGGGLGEYYTESDTRTPVWVYQNERGRSWTTCVGLFCREQLTRAAKLRRPPAAEAVEAIRTGVDRRGGLRTWIRGFFSQSICRRVYRRPNGIGTTP